MTCFCPGTYSGALAVLIIFFPVTSSLYYGMQRTNPELLELARIMGARPLVVLRWVVVPSALPAFGSGFRVATAVATIGAVVGEWVGSSSGLGYYMLHANARMQVDVMFAALEKGYFREKGLEVELIAPSNPNDPPKLVAAGKADIAVSYQHQHHMQVDRGCRWLVLPLWWRLP